MSMDSCKYPEDEDSSFLRNPGTCARVFHEESGILQENVLVLNCIDEIRISEVERLPGLRRCNF